MRGGLSGRDSFSSVAPHLYLKACVVVSTTPSFWISCEKQGRGSSRRAGKP